MAEPMKKASTVKTIEMATLWQTNAVFDEETHRKVTAIVGDENELLSRFGCELSFGTGGLRGILGEGTNRMNPYTVAKASMGLAAYLKSIHARKTAIAYDSRCGSKLFALVAAGVLAQNGLTAYIYDRLMPTPMLSFTVRELGCDAGIVITASHNPAQYNGYKVYGADGCQITDEAAALITTFIEKVAYTDLKWMSEEEGRQKKLIQDVPQAVYDAFINKTLSCRLRPQDTMNVKIVYTPLHGTGLEPVRDVFKAMRIKAVYEVAAQCVPDENFSTCPKPNPEILAALDMAITLAKESKADVVMATDPDCDRVGIAIPASDGEYEVLTGNEVGLLLLQYILQQRKVSRTLPEHPVVIKTIVTSNLALAIAQENGAEVYQTLTGFKYIGEAIGRLEKSGELSRFVFGFEESCGYLAGPHVRDKDGVQAVALVAEMTNYYKSVGKSLRTVLDEIYGTYGIMRNVLLSYEIESTLPMEKMSSVMSVLRQSPPDMLGNHHITHIRDYLPGIDGLPASDALSFATEQGEQAVVRPSGTEPKVKVYLSAKASTGDEAECKLKQMKTQCDAWMK